METDPRYWDCECDEKFIHPKAQSWCVRCDARSDEMPDSRVEEVEDWSKHARSLDFTLASTLHVLFEKAKEAMSR